ncbi:MAG TPA: nitroreductase family protein [Acidimicrobiia bacterium]|nr:nitroreductase family protein [Acidimicrobiia bacterium]
MELSEAIRRRRMVRNFEDRPVPPEALERVLDHARRAPSAGHTQGFAFLVLEGAEQVGRFWDCTFPEERRGEFRWPGLFRAPVIIVPCSSKDAYLDRYAEPDKGWTDRDQNRWPVPYWDIDCGFATMSILLTAVDEGLGALFFGIFTGLPELRASFGIPEEFHPIGAVALGWPAPDEPSPSLRRGRRPEEDVVHRGRWTA